MGAYASACRSVSVACEGLRSTMLLANLYTLWTYSTWAHALSSFFVICWKEDREDFNHE